MGVDYEQCVDFDRLRTYRLTRAQAALDGSECSLFLGDLVAEAWFFGDESALLRQLGSPLDSGLLETLK